MRPTNFEPVDLVAKSADSNTTEPFPIFKDLYTEEDFQAAVDKAVVTALADQTHEATETEHTDDMTLFCSCGAALAQDATGKDGSRLMWIYH